MLEREHRIAVEGVDHNPVVGEVGHKLLAEVEEDCRIVAEVVDRIAG